MKIWVVYHEPSAQNIKAFESHDLALAWIARAENNGDFQPDTLFLDELDFVNEHVLKLAQDLVDYILKG